MTASYSALFVTLNCTDNKVSDNNCDNNTESGKIHNLKVIITARRKIALVNYNIKYNINNDL